MSNRAKPTGDSTPMFSVVIPTYNRAELLRRACDSVLAQTWDDFELIVVDDGSTDDTPEVVDSLSDTRIRHIRCDHRGVSATRNDGARLAHGRYLVFLDSDDVALPSWLDTFSRTISDTAADLVVCGIEAVSTRGEPEWRWVPGAKPLGTSEIAAHFRPGQVALRRELFLASGGFVPALRFGENTELALRLLCRNSPPPVTATIPHVLIRVRTSGVDEDYSTSRLESAEYVLAHYRPWRRQFRQLWASYHAILGVSAARAGRWRNARRHFAAAVVTNPSREHASQLAVSMFPPAARAAWPAGSTSREP